MLGLLGSFQISLGNAPIPGLRSDKSRALLAFLAVEADRSHRRERLVGLLWPDYPEVAARHNLRQTVFGLRQVLGDHKAKCPFLLLSREEIQFNAASDFELDVAQFNTHLAAVQRHTHAHLVDCADCAAHLQQAVELYRGKFLEEFFLEDSAEFEEWALVQREGLHQHALRALAQLADYCEKQGDLAGARAHAQRQLELDPWREQAHATMMRLYALQGDRTAAMTQYETCRRVLAKELGVEPSEETRILYEQIVDGKWKPLTPSPLQHASSHLPTQLTRFVGRAREQADLAQMLSNPDCCLLTLVGPGGIGKTRLALQVGANSRAMFAQGVFFIPLDATPSLGSVVQAISTALGLSSHGHTDPQLQLLNFLRERETLLIMDNVEHLPNAGGLFVEMLHSAPKTKLLVTSREQLAVREEWIYEVKGLAVPTSQVGQVEEFDAVALFMERARRAQAGFRLTEEDKVAVVRLCRLVEGVPLALELAAAWVRTLAVSEIVREIERNLDFLSVSWRDLPERHRSLRAVFDHSWSRLAAEEQKALGWLAVFHGGFHRRAAERVAQASLPLLASLVAKSLIHQKRSGQSGRSSPVGRYEMHELVRHYAEERLIERGEREAACREHFCYFLGFAEEAEPMLIGREQVAWFNRLEEEHGNLQTALDWSLNRAGMLDSAAGEESLRLANALVTFWTRRDHWSEGRAWLERVLSQTAHLPATLERAKALNGAVTLAVQQADTVAATNLAQESLKLAHGLGDPLRIAWALNSYANVLWKKKEYAAAQSECEKGLALFRQLGDDYGVAESLHALGHLAINQDHPAQAQRSLEDSLACYRKIGDLLGMYSVMGDLGLVAYLQNQDTSARSYLDQALSGARDIENIATTEAALNRLGDLARARGDYDEAGRLYTECLDLYRRMGDRDEIPSLLHNLGYVERARGNQGRAFALFREALGIQLETGNGAGIAECLEGIGAVLTETDRPEQGARFLGAAEAQREQSRASLWPANQIEHERNITALLSAMQPAALRAAWAEGRRLPLDGFSIESLLGQDPNPRLPPAGDWTGERGPDEKHPSAKARTENS